MYLLRNGFPYGSDAGCFKSFDGRDGEEGYNPHVPLLLLLCVLFLFFYQELSKYIYTASLSLIPILKYPAYHIGHGKSKRFKTYSTASGQIAIIPNTVSIHSLPASFNNGTKRAATSELLLHHPSFTFPFSQTQPLPHTDNNHDFKGLEDQTTLFLPPRTTPIQQAFILNQKRVNHTTLPLTTTTTTGRICKLRRSLANTIST